MSFEYSVDVEERLVLVRMSGALTREEMFACTASLRNDPRVTSEFSELVDLRALTSVEAVRVEDVRTLASGPLSSATRRAIVAPDNAAFGLSRMFESLRGLKGAPDHTVVFRTMGEAEVWLGLSARPGT
jgi:hypothetical protein